MIGNRKTQDGTSPAPRPPLAELSAKLDTATSERLTVRYELRDLQQELRLALQPDPDATLEELYARAEELQGEHAKRRSRIMALEAVAPTLDRRHLLAQIALGQAEQAVEMAALEASRVESAAAQAEAEEATKRAKEAAQAEFAAMLRVDSAATRIKRARRSLDELDGPGPHG